MVRFTKEAHADLRRLYDFLVDKDPRAAAKSLKAIRHSIKLLNFSPYSCRKVATGMPRLRELLIPFGASGYVVLFEIEPPRTVTVLAARQQRGDDYQ
jgi:plasmid stabilization system protein ParE